MGNRCGCNAHYIPEENAVVSALVALEQDARGCVASGRNAEALTLLNKACCVVESNPEEWHLRGHYLNARAVVRYALADHHSALADAIAATDALPSVSLYHYNLAHIQLRALQGEDSYIAAADALRRACTLDPTLSRGPTPLPYTWKILPTTPIF